MLTASYVLLTLGARQAQVRAGMTYVVISLLSSTLFVTAIALVYTATGTLNLADLAGKMGDLPGGVRMAFSVLFLIVFGIKAGLFPLFFWLPDSYPTAPSPVTAVFAGLLTKVGVYAIIRVETLLFPTSRPTTLILVLAGLTMVIGVLGAIAQDDFKRILSFLIVSSIGFVVMGLGFFTVAGIAAAIFYIVNHIVVKTSLFLTGGLVEHVGGSSRLLGVGNMVRTAPVLAVLFAIPALSLTGVPPFAGFVAKFALVDSGFGAGEYVVVGVSLLASLLTVFSMTKIWSGVFWSPAEQLARGVRAPRPPGRPHRWAGPDDRPDRHAGRREPGHHGVGRVALRPQRTRRAGSPRPVELRAGGPRMIRQAGFVAFLLGIWLLLWGEVSVANVVSGLLVAALLLLVFPRTPSSTGFVVRPVPTLRFLVFFGRRDDRVGRACSAVRC